MKAPKAGRVLLTLYSRKDLLGSPKNLEIFKSPQRRAHGSEQKPPSSRVSPVARSASHLDPAEELTKDRRCAIIKKHCSLVHTVTDPTPQREEGDDRTVSTKSLSKDFTQGNIARQLLLFALPFMASNALQVLYSTIDMIIVGEFVGTPGLSAVSQSSQIVNFATMVCLGFSNAGQVLLAQALGAGKRKEMNDVIGTLFTFIAALALVFTCAMLCAQGWILDTMKIPAESYEMARDYLCDSFTPDEKLHRAFISLIMRSRAKLCIIPMQDWLGLDDKSRINVPSTVGKNWRWRMKASDLNSKLMADILKTAQIFGRI